MGAFTGAAATYRDAAIRWQMALWDRLKAGLARTRQGLGERLKGLLQGRQWSEDLWDSIEEILYEADLGVDLITALISDLHAEVRRLHPATADEVLVLLGRLLQARLGSVSDPFHLPTSRPQVWMLVGVNGTGKTTTAGKMAKIMRDRGYGVLLGAADTFRAAAIEQLEEWGRRASVDVVRQAIGADAAAVAFDTVRAAVARKADVAIIDTAGRLHNKSQLMQELGKVYRVIGRGLEGAPHQVWLVLDATTGQNGLAQARVFLDVVQVTGIVLTKLDGTAKGGVALAIEDQLGVPIRMVGVGETAEDLMKFDPEQYIGAILGRS